MTIIPSQHKSETHHCTSGMGSDAKYVEDVQEEAFEKYLAPLSRQLIPARKFKKLMHNWQTETSFLSSVTDISMHSAYQQIIGMGNIAMPFIMEAMEQNPGHWFWALQSITGEDPVPVEDRGKIELMTQAWLSWGRDNNYLE